MKKASGAQRFVAFLVDSIILAIVTSLISALLCLAFGLKSPEVVELSSDERERVIGYIAKETNYSKDTLLELDDKSILVYASLLDDTKYNDSAVTKAKQWYKEYTSYSIKSSVTSLIVSIILFISYYDILGYYWSKQTVGRMLLKIKVVNYDGTDSKASTLVLRDFVGFELINLLNICCFIPLIINIVLICGKDHASIGDKLSYTQMIAYDDASKETANSFDNNNVINEFNQASDLNDSYTENQTSDLSDAGNDTSSDDIHDAQIVSSDDENDK